MMEQGDNRCIIHILNEDGDFQGCGYLFNGRYAITSGSVIKHCLGCTPESHEGAVNQEIMVSLPFGSESEMRPCKILYCNCGNQRFCDCKQNQEQPVDLALIEFLKPFVFRPGSKLTGTESQEEIRVRVLDFTNDMEPGKPISGQLEPDSASGMKKLDIDKAYGSGIRPGYGGAPVFNSEDGSCIGLQIDFPEDFPGLETVGGNACCLMPAAVILKELDVFDIDGRFPIRRNPYQGPLPFEARDARDFFGRSSETTKLLELIEKNPVVPIIGAEGIGKTSLVQAGLIAGLPEGEWVTVKIVPTAELEEQIIDALLEVRDAGITTPDMFDDAIESGESGRNELVAALKNNGSTHDGNVPTLVAAVSRLFNSEFFPEGGVPKVLLFIDQFEQVFDSSVPEETRDRLFRLLDAISEDESWRNTLRIVVGLRSESYDSYLGQGSLAQKCADHELKLFKLDREMLKEIITEPAQTLSVQFEQDLVDMILIDLENEKADLATLQLILRQLWPRQRKYQISTDAYKELTAQGGLAGLRAKLIDQVNGDKPIARVHKEDKPLRRDQELTPIDEIPVTTFEPEEKLDTNGSVTNGAPVELDIAPLEESSVAVAVATDTATDEAELPETDEASPVDEPVADEVDAEAEEAAADEVSADEAVELPEGPRSGQVTSDGPRSPIQADEHGNGLVARQHVVAQGPAPVDPTEIAEDDLEELPEEEIEVGGDPAFDVTMLPVSSEAEKSERIASRANDVHKTRNPDLQLATLLAVEAARVDANLMTNSVLRESIKHLPRAVHSFKQTHTVWSTVFSNNGRLVATAGGDRSARVFDLESGNELHCINHKDIIRYVAFSSNDCLLASVSSDGVANVTNVETGDRICQIVEPTKIHGMAFSKDGRMLALSSYTSAKVYRVDTGEEVLHSRHGDKIYAVAFSDDTSLLATGSHDGKIKVFRLRSGTEIADFEHRDWVISVSFSPDNTLLASASGDRTARVWRISTGEEVCCVKHDDWVRSVVFNHDGRFIATAGGDHTASVWYVNIGKEVCRVIHDDWVRAVSFSPDGKLLATSSRDGTAKITEIKSSKPLLKIHHNGSVNTARFNPDGSLVGTASSDGTARICPMVSSEGICKVDHEGAVNDLSFTPDGSQLVTVGEDRMIKQTRVATNELMRTISGEEQQQLSRINNTGQLVATGGTDGSIAVYDVDSGERLCRTSLDGEITALTFSPDSTRLAASAGSGDLIALDLNSGKVENRLKLDSAVKTIDFNNNGKFLAVGCTDGVTAVYRIGRELEMFRVKFKDPVNSVSFNFKSSLIVTAGQDGTARVSKVNGGNGVCMVRHDGIVNTAEINANNKHIVTASDDGTARIWRMDTGAELFRINHDGPVYSAHFNVEGNLVITASEDGSSKVCLATTGEELCRIWHDGPVNAAQFNGEGSQLATAGADGIAKVSYRFTSDLMREARRRLTRNFSQTEWKRYFGRETYRRTVPWLPDGE